MDQGLKEFIKNLCRDNSRKMVGRICKNIEILQNQPKCNTETKEFLDLQKSLIKEIIYEEFRDLRNAVIFYSEGREYQKIPIYNPTKDKES